jgi:hypothetical protein
MTGMPRALRLCRAALIHLIGVLPLAVADAQQPTISPAIDFKWQEKEVPIRDGNGVDWSGSTFCALTRVEFLSSRGSFPSCKVRRDPAMGWVISTGSRYLQECSVVCWKQ